MPEETCDHENHLYGADAPFDHIFIDALVPHMRYEALVKLCLSSEQIAQYLHDRWYAEWLRSAMQFMRTDAGVVVVEAHAGTTDMLHAAKCVPVLDGGSASIRQWNVLGGVNLFQPLEARFTVRLQLMLDQQCRSSKLRLGTEVYAVQWVPSAVGVLAPVTFYVHVKRKRGRLVVEQAYEYTHRQARAGHMPKSIDRCLHYRPFVLDSFEIFPSEQQQQQQQQQPCHNSVVDRIRSKNRFNANIERVRLIATFSYTETLT